ncbi:hypothetical protein GCM10011430_24140 [Oxalicibacterium solurbis]|uniref:Uncharacterized protein n=1 Tax=Oxalicibacterium solurbis TaxID=69280 RepID=A0A8J3AXN7_9BURK|nr:hypothetical protein GCM10011430_24140 [Oxalicibacterium solurbis]
MISTLAGVCNIVISRFEPVETGAFRLPLLEVTEMAGNTGVSSSAIAGWAANAARSTPEAQLEVVLMRWTV